MTYVPAEVARNIRIVTGNNIRHKCGSGPDERRSLACSERSPECNLAVSDAESLEHQHADHIEDYEWKPHCEICRRHPFQR